VFVLKEEVEMRKKYQVLRGGLAAAAVLSLYGCASTGGDGPSKAERKISQAIGVEIEDFKVLNRSEGVSAPMGFSEGIYTVNTKSGKTYKCSIMEPNGVMNAMSWGGAGSAGAMCTDFTKGSKDAGITNKASCNALLKADGKC